MGPAIVSIQGLQDTGNGFIWTDQEMADFFPALAQMPLGDMALGGRYNNLLNPFEVFDWQRWVQHHWNLDAKLSLIEISIRIRQINNFQHDKLWNQ